MKIRDRVVEIRKVKAKELLDNPKNWRKHSKYQKRAFQGLLSEIGNATIPLVYETPDGLMLIDGHLRKEMLGSKTIRVAVLDVTEQEADKLLATIDPLTALVDQDSEAFQELVERLEFQAGEVQALVAGVLENSEFISWEGEVDADPRFDPNKRKVSKLVIKFPRAREKDLVPKLKELIDSLNIEGLSYG